MDFFIQMDVKAFDNLKTPTKYTTIIKIKPNLRFILLSLLIFDSNNSKNNTARDEIKFKLI